MAGTILYIIALHLQHQDLKGAAIELPFFLLSLLIIYLQHMLKKIALPPERRLARFLDIRSKVRFPLQAAQ